MLHIVQQFFTVCYVRLTSFFDETRAGSRHAFLAEMIVFVHYYRTRKNGAKKVIEVFPFLVGGAQFFV
jgi:hypothetical protein